MNHEKVYAVCENLCWEETLTKEQMNNKFLDKTDAADEYQSKILTGTTDPTSDVGEDGDIYLKYVE